MSNLEAKDSTGDSNEEGKHEQLMGFQYKQCCLLDFYNILQQDIALYDIRTKDQYKISHIKYAQNITDPSHFKQFKSNRYLFFSIVIYGDNESNTGERLKYLFNIAQSQDKADKFYVFDGVYIDFYNKYKFLCVDEESKEKPFIDYPAMLLQDELFIGDANMAQNNEIMANLQITHIVNVSSFLNENLDNKIKYYQIKIYDDGSDNIINYFDKVYEFINPNKNKKSKVFVHCMMGISRSSTICIAYLMKSKNYSLDDAYLLTKKARPQIQPNGGFWDQLTKYEQQIQQNKTTNK